MSKYKKASAILVLALAYISAFVSGMQFKIFCFEKSAVFAAICLYWIVLTAKNLIDWKGMQKNGCTQNTDTERRKSETPPK